MGKGFTVKLRVGLGLGVKCNITISMTHTLILKGDV